MFKTGELAELYFYLPLKEGIGHPNAISSHVLACDDRSQALLTYERTTFFAPFAHLLTRPLFFSDRAEVAWLTDDRI